jgi:hypothetical protein
MADPITMAVVGGSIGAMTNKKDPLKGALLGAAGGYGGGALMGAGGFGAGASSGVLPSALSGSTTVASSTLPVGAAQAFTTGPTAAMQAANLTTGPSGVLGVEAAKSGLFGGATPLTNTAMQGQGLAQTGAMQRSLSLGMPGVEASSLYEPTFMDRVSQVGQYAQQNPQLTNQAMQSAQQSMRQPQAQFAPAGQVNRGQIQGGDYMSLLNPQQGSVLRPQPISLLG